MKQRKAQAGNQDGPDGLAFWKEGEQSAQEIELKKGLLNERPGSVGDEDDEDFPVEDAFGDNGPTALPAGENSAVRKKMSAVGTVIQRVTFRQSSYLDSAGGDVDQITFFV